MPRLEVELRIKEASKRLLHHGNVRVICLGCAGMAGFDQIVREGCRDAVGSRDGDQVIVIDGVLAAVDLIARSLSDFNVRVNEY